jgi:hypothetical protein
MTDLSWYQQSGGVLYVDAETVSRTPDRVVADIGAGGAFGTTAYLTMTAIGTVLNPSVAPLNLSSSVPVTTLRTKMAAKLELNSSRMVAGGILGGLDTSCNIPTAPTALTIGRGGWSGGANHLNGIIREIAFIPNTSIPDSALQRMTR